MTQQDQPDNKPDPLKAVNNTLTPPEYDKLKPSQEFEEPATPHQRVEIDSPERHVPPERAAAQPGADVPPGSSGAAAEKDRLAAGEAPRGQPSA
jgi:hypothetical protein